jgi:hypothetical protein
VTEGRFTGADRHAAEALDSAIDALAALGARYDELELRIRSCDDFVVGHAYTAFLAELGGDGQRAERVASHVRTWRRSITRRERQLVEVLLLVIDGDRDRAAGLAGEHIAEFGEDADVLALIARWHPRGH